MANDRVGDERLDQPAWPPEDVKRIVDVLADSIFVIDGSATVLYLNPAASTLLGRAAPDLIGRPMAEILPPDQVHWVDLLTDAIEGSSTEIAGSYHKLSLLDSKGRRIPVELVASVGVTRTGWPVLIAVVRPREHTQLQRLTLFTEQLLLEVLGASSSSSPAEQLLASLCRRLGWDVGALWGLQPDGTLICRGVWTVPEAPASAYVEEKRRNPRHDVGGLARLVMEHGSPVWFTDLASEARFTSEGVLEDGLTSACALPVRYRGVCLGAIKMMSRVRRHPDPDLIELVAAISGPLGAILHALEQSAERDEVVLQLEATQRHLELLLRANQVISEAKGYAQALDRLAEVAVPALADLCLIDVVQDDGTIRRLAARHSDPTKTSLVAELARYAPDTGGHHPSAQVMASGRSSWLHHMSEEFLRMTSRDEHHLRVINELGFTSYMTVPLMIGDRVKGTVTLVSAGSGRRFTEADLTGAEQLAGQVAGVVERARQFDWERQVSHTLQRSLLPDRLPLIPGLALAARYLPGAEDAEVGGDWYDAVPFGEHRVALIVGDVEGHDMLAASVMGTLRHALALLLSEGAAPAEALERLNAFVVASAITHIATVLVADVDVASGAVRIASAGHPPPILVGTGGSVVVPIRPGPPLGLEGTKYEESRCRMGHESFVLFTDGLVERRDKDFGEGMAQLVRATERAATSDPGRLIDRVVQELLDQNRGTDDVALLVATRLEGRLGALSDQPEAPMYTEAHRGLGPDVT